MRSKGLFIKVPPNKSLHQRPASAQLLRRVDRGDALPPSLPPSSDFRLRCASTRRVGGPGGLSRSRALFYVAVPAWLSSSR
jgi:hypothetical protein